VITRAEAERLVEAVIGARVDAASVVSGVLVLELFHRETDDGAYRLAVSLSGACADEWPWPQGDEA
jgi:hypothetical protein